MTKINIVIGFITSLLFSVSSQAVGPDILPGLWENQMGISSESGQMEIAMERVREMMLSLPAEEREMMKEKMASQGMNYDFGSRTIQVCLTQKQIDNNFPLPQPDLNCLQTLEQQSTNRFRMIMRCNDQITTGEGEFIVLNKKAYSGTVIMDFEMNGQRETMTMTQQGQWLSSDCGGLRSQ